MGLFHVASTRLPAGDLATPSEGRSFACVQKHKLNSEDKGTGVRSRTDEKQLGSNPLGRERTLSEVPGQKKARTNAPKFGSRALSIRPFEGSRW